MRGWNELSEDIDTILISHAHKDEKYVTELVELIKVTGIEKAGVKIICSSFPGHGIPGDVNIYDYLKRELNGNVWVIYVLSQNYYNSAACLNEMGATWVQNKKYSTFLIPNFQFSEIRGAIDPAKNSFKLNDKRNLNDFKNILLEAFKLKVNDNIWESVRDTALERITGIAKLELEKSKMTEVDYESVINSNEGKLTLVLRVKNDNAFAMDLIFIKVTLKDSNGNVFTIEDESVSIRVHSKENKLIFKDYELGDSHFSVARNDVGIVEEAKFSNVY